MPVVEKSGVRLEVLEPLFANIPPIRRDINLLRGIVWAAQGIRAARIVRVSTPNITIVEGNVADVTEIPRPVTYIASLAVPHSKDGLNVYSANWTAGPGQNNAYLQESGSNYQYFDVGEAETLVSPEDILEAYDARTRHVYMANAARMADLVNLKPNIYNADGFEELALSTPTE
jgi:hypothetical protein